jgi:hypothetical protein
MMITMFPESLLLLNLLLIWWRNSFLLLILPRHVSRDSEISLQAKWNQFRSWPVGEFLFHFLHSGAINLLYWCKEAPFKSLAHSLSSFMPADRKSRSPTRNPTVTLCLPLWWIVLGIEGTQRASKATLHQCVAQIVITVNVWRWCKWHVWCTRFVVCRWQGTVLTLQWRK